MINYIVGYKDLLYNLMPHILRDHDIEFDDGDIKQGDTLEQEIFIIMESDKGQFYQDIKIGVGLARQINANINKPQLKKRIKSALEYDNIMVQRINIFNKDDLLNAGINDADLMSEVDKNKYLIDIEAGR